jgi:hypothetical protein
MSNLNPICNVCARPVYMGDWQGRRQWLHKAQKGNPIPRDQVHRARVEGDPA